MNLANEILDSASTAPLIGGANVADVQSAQATPTSPWYALYTCPRHEKCVAQQIEQRRIDCFLPLYRSVRRWKDRRKELELALFPGYVFVRLALPERFRVLQLPSAVRLVSFNGQPAALPEGEIEQLRERLSRGGCVEPHPYLRVGRRVRVRGGPMQGLEGIIVRRKDRCRVVFSLDLIMRSVAVEVDESDVEPASEWQMRNRVARDARPRPRNL
jgi:transcription antitermination factor NusG